MKSYLEETMEKVEETINIENSPKIKGILNNAREILKDPKF